MSIHVTLKYADADAALAFLTGPLGLTEVQVNRDGAGTIAHAELAHGTDVLLVGTRNGGEFDTGKAVVYLAVDDPDAHHARAVAAGATVVQQLVDQPYGSREYAVSDPEGNIWSIGTYRPGVS
ncbi:VOC family protein [Pseudonocardia sp. GCM10023141]|uniref:VOC family protein n=1 Tax=Pseudonocardia sp. GCM10023141 TaxID=3252653 RepID=UPI00360C84BC